MIMKKKGKEKKEEEKEELTNEENLLLYLGYLRGIKDAQAFSEKMGGAGKLSDALMLEILFRLGERHFRNDPDEWIKIVGKLERAADPLPTIAEAMREITGSRRGDEKRHRSVTS